MAKSKPDNNAEKETKSKAAPVKQSKPKGEKNPSVIVQTRKSQNTTLTRVQKMIEACEGSQERTALRLHLRGQSLLGPLAA